MKKVTIALVIFLLLLGFVIYLQVFLSKMKSKWFGLILPALSIIYSLFMMVFGIGVFDGMGKGQMLISLISTFFISNIPTIILLAIYFGIREKIKLSSQIDKMNIKDL